MIATIAVLAALSLPKPAITPGVVQPLTTAQICGTRWGLDVRHVSAKDRREVFGRYGVRAADQTRYVIDHLIPRELGGDDVAANLWPQRIPEAHVKDRDENRLHRAVCAGTIDLATAQDQMRTWGR